ncbi:hypothetical protein EDC44_12823 [Cricetibacter osteomyelitidis]|uniref:Uncharacterized protein n=1 Tax=Cricetibacter osteomyelitidis TaxID=1521931 RepID=A0A4R2SRX0_9PAST|nr:hypothetical protein EDC44_12823 [Cricetibacter osteomyelitidis]
MKLCSLLIIALKRSVLSLIFIGCYIWFYRYQKMMVIDQLDFFLDLGNIWLSLKFFIFLFGLNFVLLFINSK